MIYNQIVLVIMGVDPSGVLYRSVGVSEDACVSSGCRGRSPMIYLGGCM